MNRWKLFWQWQYHDGYGFTALTPLFAIECYINFIKHPLKRALWRGWRVLLWPFCILDEGKMLTFYKTFEHIEEISYMEKYG